MTADIFLQVHHFTHEILRCAAVRRMTQLIFCPVTTSKIHDTRWEITFNYNYEL